MAKLPDLVIKVYDAWVDFDIIKGYKAYALAEICNKLKLIEIKL